MTTFNGRSYLSENELRLYDKLIKVDCGVTFTV